MSRNSKSNEWEKRFGAIRRAKDKAYCEEAERQIAIDEAVTQALSLENIETPDDCAALSLSHASEPQTLCSPTPETF